MVIFMFDELKTTLYKRIIPYYSPSFRKDIRIYVLTKSTNDAENIDLKIPTRQMLLGARSGKTVLSHSSPAKFN